MNDSFLKSSIRQFEQYKSLGEKTFDQLDDASLYYTITEDSNSIAMIVKHLWGNMLSRWTDFLTSDGEKDWRERDAEFENDIKSREELLEKWHAGWNCLFGVLKELKEEDMGKTVTIRTQPLTVTDAILRQLAHYAYHVGQIVFIGKILAKGNWTSLSIPKGESKSYNNALMEAKKN